MTEIMKFQLVNLDSVHFIAAFVAMAYQKTGSKFSVEWCGSKGYLSHLQINAEGDQPEDTNRIWVKDLFTKKGEFRKKTVTVNYSFESGVVLKVA